MDEARRTSAEEAQRRVESGQALLVCAYEDEARCQQLRIDHSLTMEELKRQLERDQASRDRELIFYCA